jgi:hypothetical protein
VTQGVGPEFKLQYSKKKKKTNNKKKPLLGRRKGGWGGVEQWILSYSKIREVSSGALLHNRRTIDNENVLYI